MMLNLYCYLMAILLKLILEDDFQVIQNIKVPIFILLDRYNTACNTVYQKNMQSIIFYTIQCKKLLRKCYFFLIFTKALNVISFNTVQLI